MTFAQTRRFSLLGLFGLALFMLRDVLFFGGAFYQRDLLSIYGSSMDAFVRAVAEGALPLRDPTSAFGQPLLGNPDAQIAYPPTWLNLFLLPERAYPFISLFHYTLAAVGAGAFCHRLTRSTAGGFLAGAFWMVGGPLQSFLSVWHHFAGAAWMPWVLLAADRLFEKVDRWRLVTLGTAFGLQILAGSADMCAMTLVLVLLLLLCQAPTTPRAQLFRQFGAAIGALFLAACLGAATWLSVAEVLSSSHRASLPEDIRNYWSIHPALLTELFMPLNLGSLNLAPELKDALFEGREPFVKSLFLGPLVLPLLIGALLSARIPARYRVFGGVTLVVAVLVSLGRFTPVSEFLTTLVPPLRIFRYPSKLIIPISLVTAVLSGAVVFRLEGRARQATRVVTAVLIALHLALLYAVPQFLPQLASDPALIGPMELALTGDLLRSVGCLLLLALALAPRDAPPRALVFPAVAAILATLVIDSRINPAIARSALRFRPETVAAVQTPHPSRLYVEDYVHWPDRSRRFLGRDSPFMEMKLGDVPPPLATVVAVKGLLFPPIGAPWGVEYAWDMDLRGLYSGPLRDLTDVVGAHEGTPPFLRLLQLANVSHVVALHGSSFGALRPPRLIEGLPFREPVQVFEVPGTRPRAYAVSGVRVVDLAGAVRTVVDPAFALSEEVVLDGGVSRASSASFRSEVTIIERRSDGATLTAKLNEPGTVVLLEGFLPGWTATMDGVEVTVRRANALFLAVAAPAGTHTIVFRYRPPGALLGLGLSGLAAILLLVFQASRRLTSARTA